MAFENQLILFLLTNCSILSLSCVNFVFIFLFDEMELVDCTFCKLTKILNFMPTIWEHALKTNWINTNIQEFINICKCHPYFDYSSSAYFHILCDYRNYAILQKETWSWYSQDQTALIHSHNDNIQKELCEVALYRKPTFFLLALRLVGTLEWGLTIKLTFALDFADLKLSYHYCVTNQINHPRLSLGTTASSKINCNDIINI